MIETEFFTWWHIGKTGGNYTRDVIRDNLKFVTLKQYKHNEPEKHITPIDYYNKYGSCNNYWVCNFRKLPSYILSHYFHRLKFSKKNPDWEKYKAGYIWQMDDGWIKADDLIIQYEIEKMNLIIRLEHIDNDLSNLFDKFGFEYQSKPPMNTNNYDRTISNYFTDDDILNLYNNNPLWWQIENNIYNTQIL